MTFRIKKEILPVVQSLCQDVDYEVRGCMCRQLDCVARGMGSVQTQPTLSMDRKRLHFPKNLIIEMLRDLNNDVNVMQNFNLTRVFITHQHLVQILQPGKLIKVSDDYLCFLSYCATHHREQS